MAEYCSASDLSNRLTAAGYFSMVDQDRSGDVTQVEVDAFITPAIVYAGNMIDGYLVEQVIGTGGRAASNPWLKDRCIDIAVYQCFLTRNGEVPSGVQAAFENTVALLQEVQNGRRIPQFPYPAPTNAAFVHHGPHCANIGESSAGQRVRRLPYPLK